MSDSMSARQLRQFDDIDAMPAPLRGCVHEYGYAIVSVCRKYGITNPAHIHDLVREIWEGARAARQKRRLGSTLDWLLAQAGAEITGKELARVLRNNNLYIVPHMPTTAMVEASLSEVSGHKVLCTKRQKHERRLTAALRAGADYVEAQLSAAPRNRAPERQGEAA